jgi:hypothetical protein
MYLAPVEHHRWIGYTHPQLQSLPFERGRGFRAAPTAAAHQRAGQRGSMPAVPFAGELTEGGGASLLGEEA